MWQDLLSDLIEDFKGEVEPMGKGGRYGKYGELKRFERLRQKKQLGAKMAQDPRQKDKNVFRKKGKEKF